MLGLDAWAMTEESDNGPCQGKERPEPSTQSAPIWQGSMALLMAASGRAACIAHQLVNVLGQPDGLLQAGQQPRDAQAHIGHWVQQQVHGHVKQVLLSSK